MTSQFSDMRLLSNFFDVVLILLWSLVTVPSFMSISSLVLELRQFPFIRVWLEIRKSEIPPVWVLPNLLRLGQVGDIKFGTNISNKMLLNAAEYQGHSFYRFWVFKGKSTVRGRGKIIPLTQIRVKRKNDKVLTFNIVYFPNLEIRASL